MLRSIREKVTIKRGGLVELRRPELIEGTEAEVIVVVQTGPRDETSSLDDLPRDRLGPWPLKLSPVRPCIFCFLATTADAAFSFCRHLFFVICFRLDERRPPHYNAYMHDFGCNGHAANRRCNHM
jgi:hypothetical protein